MIIDFNKKQIEDETLKIVPFPTLFKKKYLFFINSETQFINIVKLCF